VKSGGKFKKKDLSNDDLIDEEITKPFYAPVQLADRENMIEIIEDDLEASKGTLNLNASR